MSDDTNLQAAVATEYLALADLLEVAPDAQWDTLSLCEGWRVREVIAHLTMAARYSEEEFMAELHGKPLEQLSRRTAGVGTTAAPRLLCFNQLRQRVATFAGRP